ncbi:metal dependent phosphohydrolase [Thermodesulfitimonas autotrophica]|uniref:Metal dependent phosphohydrolase n=1 Tax=Thermodesulfitimonas autotrophica TaxID=1894989 RepID=A0A3N5AAD3_9THEO|nr:HD-GYP domain-containing protein [Thermodesulfitimonas autotrophica]RPF42569.1 metal dependent phosphohydrolase [Thermodesulfitimonas autotrophica]
MLLWWRSDPFHAALECLVAALEARDPYTGGHSQRVAEMVWDLARRAGLSRRECVWLHLAAHLHDIGKIGVPDNILRKPGKLFPHEWAQMQRHPEIGYEILSRSPRLKAVARTVLHHHERWDGKGYPLGLKGEAIPLGVRLIAVCDAIDAMTSARPYRPARTWAECRAELQAVRGLQLDPALVDFALALLPRWERRYGVKGPRVDVVLGQKPVAEVAVKERLSL